MSKNRNKTIYRAVLKKVRKALGLRFWDYRRGGKRRTYNEIKKDLKCANLELLTYLLDVDFDSIGKLIIRINTWLKEKEEKNRYRLLRYTIGNGRNVFYRYEIEKELSEREKQ